MRTKVIFLVILLFAAFAYEEVTAQISLYPAKIKGVQKLSVKERRADVIVFNEKNREEAIDDKVLLAYKNATEDIYEDIKGKEFDKLSARNKSIYLLHKHFNDIDTIVRDTIVKFRDNITNAQAHTGMNFFNNESGSSTTAAVQLGGRLNNLRISLPTKTRFKIDSTGVGRNKKHTLYYTRTRNFLYFDFISRGLVSFDSIARTLSEYVSSPDGSILTGRFKLQKNLMPAYLSGTATGFREPSLHWVFNLDGRLVPIASATKIDDAGLTANIITGFVFLAPSGQSGSELQDDDFIVQLMFNGAIASNSVKDALMPRALGYTRSDVLISAEIRVGNYSKIDPMRNFTAFAKYCFQSTIGPQWTAGVSFSPQGKTSEPEKPDNAPKPEQPDNDPDDN